MPSQPSLFILIHSYSNAASFFRSSQKQFDEYSDTAHEPAKHQRTIKTIRAVKFKHHYIGNFHRLRNSARIEGFTINSVKIARVRLLLFHMLYFDITL